MITALALGTPSDISEGGCSCGCLCVVAEIFQQVLPDPQTLMFLPYEIWVGSSRKIHLGWPGSQHCFSHASILMGGTASILGK